MTSGYQPGQDAQSRTFATITSNFERNPDKEAEVIALRSSTITLTVPIPQANLPATALTEEEETEEDIARQINQIFFDVNSPPQLDNPPLTHTPPKPITPDHSPNPSPPQPPSPPPPPPLDSDKDQPQLAASKQPKVVVIPSPQLEKPSAPIPQTKDLTSTVAGT